MDLKGLLPVMTVLTAVGLGVILHSPYSQPSLYTDILGFFWSDFAAAGRTPYLETGETGSHFEYPFLSGLVSILAWRLGGDLGGFYTVYSTIVMLFAGIMAYAAYRLSNNYAATLIYMAAPSLVVYGIYGYDVLLAALTALSVLMFIKGRYCLSATLLALGFHTKLYSILFLPYAVLRLKGCERLRYLVIFGAAALTPVLAMPEAFRHVLEAQFRLGLENAWYVHLFPDAATTGPNPPPGLGAATLFGVLGTVFLYIYVLRPHLQPQYFMLLAVSVFLLFAPRYTPQTSILLLPFLPATGPVYLGYPIWELSNAAILLTWFTTPAPHSPWSITQTMSLIRFAALSAMFVQGLVSLGLLRLEWHCRLLGLPRPYRVLRRAARGLRASLTNICRWGWFGGG